MSEKTEKNRARYEAAAHAMQSGVALKMNYDPSETTPKHLRTGVNSAMVDSASLAGLLMKKGLISEEEYFEALADGMEREKKMYEEWINDHLKSGKRVTLG